MAPLGFYVILSEFYCYNMEETISVKEFLELNDVELVKRVRTRKGSTLLLGANAQGVVVCRVVAAHGAEFSLEDFKVSQCFPHWEEGFAVAFLPSNGQIGDDAVAFDW